MKLIFALEIIFWLAAAYVIFRQIVVPLWNNEKTFPIFRARRKLEKKLRDTHTAVGDYELFQQIRSEAEKLPAPEPPPMEAPTQILPKKLSVSKTRQKSVKR